MAQESPPPAVVAGEVVERPAALPRTGNDILPEVAVGLGLTAAGVVLVVSTRRRAAQAS